MSDEHLYSNLLPLLSLIEKKTKGMKTPRLLTLLLSKETVALDNNNVNDDIITSPLL